jgi:hypothetical protein
LNSRNVRSSALPRHACVQEAPLDGWQLQPLSLVEMQFKGIGALAPDEGPEPTFSEYLPGNANYWSADAPVALRHFS